MRLKRILRHSTTTYLLVKYRKERKRIYVEVMKITSQKFWTITRIYSIIHIICEKIIKLTIMLKIKYFYILILLCDICSTIYLNTVKDPVRVQHGGSDWIVFFQSYQSIVLLPSSMNNYYRLRADEYKCFLAKYLYY